MPALSPTVTAPSLPDLQSLLHRVFGHREFRAHQQTVCEAAAGGRDVLLVMPTGAGKSLCYQLPALARGSTALVISPLIALMDDQAGKLSALGLRVARIHSGLPREDARTACRAYLAGDLDFLFIAPERLRVPGFAEMLARRKPGLLAIDEAHCISQWGHDFRPDYRTLGQHLPALRPTPIIALTATATPTVQRDIARQLNLQDPAVFITGFRRDNLAIEVRELSKPQRTEFTADLLVKPSARPAIVYASSRKSAEELALALSKRFPAAAYHAGMEAGARERVQTAFLSGKLDVVVATVAFGMGIDKADVRTVVHIALPGSVEAFYQEIGRAGRDGLPSRTVLLHSFADRKTQEFLLDRSYPASTELRRLLAAMEQAPGAEPAYFEPEHLQRKLGVDHETLGRLLEKLLGLGVLEADMTGAVRLSGRTAWETEYDAQVGARRSQIDRMVAFAESTQCRMTALVEHFGDSKDRGKPCGRCDVCAPGSGTDTTLHPPDAEERTLLRSILSALHDRSLSTGKLFTEVATVSDRKQFDGYLDALARAGLLTLTSDSFRAEDGRQVPFRKAAVTAEGRTPDDKTLATVWLRGDIDVGSAKRTARKPNSRSMQGASSSPTQQPGNAEAAELSPAQESLLEILRTWRLDEARKLGKPAFFLFSDKLLRAIAVARPQTPAALERLSGVGPAKVEAYATAVLRLCAEEARPSDTTPPPVTQRNSNPPPLRARPQMVTDANPKQNTDAEPAPKPRSPAAQRPAPRPELPPELTADQQALEARLRAWRSEEARRAGLPSFFILSDSALRAIAQRQPTLFEDLRGVRGVDAEKVTRFGTALLDLCHA